MPSAKVFGSPATRVASPASEPLTLAFSSTPAVPDAAAMACGVTVSETVAVEVWPEASVTT